jgi:hypothetical protein
MGGAGISALTVLSSSTYTQGPAGGLPRLRAQCDGSRCPGGQQRHRADWRQPESTPAAALKRRPPGRCQDGLQGGQIEPPGERPMTSDVGVNIAEGPPAREQEWGGVARC